MKGDARPPFLHIIINMLRGAYILMIIQHTGDLIRANLYLHKH